MLMDKTEAPVVMAQNVFAMFDAISLIASIASLILAVIAIWLTISFKKDSDKVNRETSELLVEIKSESKSISQGVMSELKAYGDTMRGTFGNNSTISNSFTGQPTEFSISNNKPEGGSLKS
jgi:hypothetical protein